MEKVETAETQWKQNILDKRVKRFNLSKSPTRFYSPLANKKSDFLENVGFPGQYPFTAGSNPFDFWRAYAEDAAKMGYRPDWGGASGVGKYGGFGTAEDYRDYLIRMHAMGRTGGPNMNFTSI